MMQSVGEHQEVSKEETGVKSSGAMKKRRRGRNLATERRQKQKEGPGNIVDPRKE
jgi:hypothetical protein